MPLEERVPKGSQLGFLSTHDDCSGNMLANNILNHLQISKTIFDEESSQPETFSNTSVITFSKIFEIKFSEERVDTIVPIEEFT